jgi:hypothetical protein
VKLYNWPATADRAAFKAFRGHSSHVTLVLFDARDEHVFSAGGMDCAVMQWKVRAEHACESAREQRPNEQAHERSLFPARFLIVHPT